MKKKAYITPVSGLVNVEIEQLMLNLSNSENIGSEEEDPEDEIQRARRRRNVWEDEEEEDYGW